MAKTIEQVLDPFLAQADEALGTGYSAVLYGSAARGGWRADHSDINLILVLDQIGADRLAALAPAFAEWRRSQPEPPLVIERAEWGRAADSFPIEITAMKAAYRVLRGTDPVTGLAVEREDLRSALERELRGRLLRLRQGYVVFSRDAAALGHIAAESGRPVVALLRALLALAGDHEPTDAEEVVARAAARAGFPADPVLTIIRHRADDDWRCAPDEFARYLAALAEATRYADHYQPGDTR